MAHALVPGFYAEVPPLPLRIVNPRRPGNRRVRRAVGRRGGPARPVPSVRRGGGMKILAVNCLRTGHTRQLARRLARDLDANTVAITEQRDRRPGT